MCNTYPEISPQSLVVQYFIFLLQILKNNQNKKRYIGLLLLSTDIKMLYQRFLIKFRKGKYFMKIFFFAIMKLSIYQKSFCPIKNG